MRQLILTVIILAFSCHSFAQVSYDGPAQGSVAAGVTQTTDNFNRPASPPQPRLKIFNNFGERRNYQQFESVTPLGKEGSNFVLDPSYGLEKASSDSVIIYRSMNGIPDLGTSIPPDPYIAVGPDHIIEVVNSIMQIRDKDGKILKTIAGDDWFGTALIGANVFDPKVIYDHYAGRWVMVWLHLNKTTSESYYLLSVSDDDDPLGDWFNWVMPGNTNGDTPDAFWADYPGLGFDDKAVYLCSDQFTYDDVFQYERIRIINKNQIYIDGNPGQLIWKDLWNIKYPGTNAHPYMIRPTRMYSASDEYYLMVIEPSPAGTVKNSFGLFKLTDPLNNPALDGDAIPVTEYNDPANPGQLGGGRGFKIWDANIFNEPFYRDGVIHVTHTIKNGDHCDIRYLAVNTADNTVLRDLAIGAPGYFYFYSALAVNQNNDVLLTYTRSADIEYAGAYFLILPSSSGQPTGSITLQNGKANYVKTFGGTDNRWGDYMGAWIDPADQNNFWVATEYTAATNTYGVWVAAIRPFPFEGVYAVVSDNDINYGEVELGSSSSFDLKIKSYGDDALVINSIDTGSPAFTLEGLNGFPITLPAYDSLSFQVKFEPVSEGVINTQLAINGNLPSDQSIDVNLTGEGFAIAPAADNVFYASTGSSSSGAILTIDPLTGTGAALGSSLRDLVSSIAINPVDKQIYGFTVNSDVSKIVRIDAETGRAFDKLTVNKILTAMSFDLNGKIIASTTEGDLLKIDPANGAFEVIGNEGIVYTSLTVHPQSGELWGGVKTGGAKDEIHRINKTDGSSTIVGKTGSNQFTDALIFDKDGKLYGITALPLQASKLIAIDLTTAAATDIGTTGYKGVKGLAVFNDPILNAESENIRAELKFALEQNYPNPFNPSTKIKYSIPLNVETRRGVSPQHIILKVYDILGREVATLVNEHKKPGTYEVELNASHLASGVYIVKLTAGELSQSRKIILMK